MRSMVAQPACGLRCRQLGRQGTMGLPRRSITTHQASAPTHAPEADIDATEEAMRRSVKERMGTLPKSEARGIVESSEDLKAKFMKIQAEVSSYRALSVDNQKLDEEVARLRQENGSLAEKVAAQQVEAAAAVELARHEAVGPLQQQLDELSAQLQNSQSQLQRLGEAVEAAELDKAAALKPLQEENTQLLAALAGAAGRLSEVIYPAGSLPAGLSITTRLEGAVELPDAAALASSAAQPAAASPDSSSASSGSGGQPEGTDEATAAATKQREAGGGFLGWLAGVVGYWAYQVLGALLLYYSAAILRGAPPALTLEFGLGCVLVCTLLPFVNRLLVPRTA